MPKKFEPESVSIRGFLTGLVRDVTWRCSISGQLCFCSGQSRRMERKVEIGYNNLNHYP